MLLVIIIAISVKRKAKNYFIWWMRFWDIKKQIKHLLKLAFSPVKPILIDLCSSTICLFKVYQKQGIIFYLKITKINLLYYRINFIFSDSNDICQNFNYQYP